MIVAQPSGQRRRVMLGQAQVIAVGDFPTTERIRRPPGTAAASLSLLPSTMTAAVQGRLDRKRPDAPR
jgi:hypothetical protein